MRLKTTLFVLLSSIYTITANAGLIHTGDGMFALDSRDATYMKITSSFGTISDFGIYFTNSWGAKTLYTLVPERTEILRNDVFYANMFNNTPLKEVYSWNGEQIIDYDYSNGDVFGFYMLTGGYHFSETDISFTGPSGNYSEGELNLSHVNTITNVTFSEHPFSDAFYPDPLPTTPPIEVSEPATALLFCMVGLLVIRQKRDNPKGQIAY
ncbi:hypothetical protein [Colwellia psychrerythraea]|uniref:PEP motif anchor domain protein n=1 Tax=Colwellia psychrerythraea TaxID=28229 RepID=A0A099L4S1_COLPS|nr:hypothetical protein [Colwellia psychrerythraea]KGJ97440.1 hypothetical protein GAB14E_1029 [Colwellia psychrerythraea]